ncbi:MAG: ABC-type uncharacterized transport system involved in gliding motility auxiliary subunit [Planctomycetota bacterium]|jgi:ABC-type uncharacterized transport system involved in gliding motility auxiliary subunit
MKKSSLIALPILLVLFFAINMASNSIFKTSRIDLTEAKLFTLSDGTRNILAEMEEPVTLRLFYSATLAKEEAQVLERYHQRVSELLAEYEVAANGNLTIITIDPEPFSVEEDQAVEFGMRGVPVNSAGELVYFGIAGSNSTDGQESIPFIELPRENFLEYDLTKLIYSLSSPVQSRVGVLTTLPLTGAPGNPADPRTATPPWFFLSQVEAAFETVMIARNATELPEDLDLLLLIHPKQLDPQLLFSIDQFALNNGHIVAFMDPHAEADMEEINPQDQMSAFSANRTSDLGPLSAVWGFELVGEKIAVDKDNAHKVRLPTGGELDYLAWLNLNESNVDGDDTVTSELKKLHMATAGILEQSPGATTEFQVLVHTSKNSMQVDRIRVAMRPDPEGLMDSFVSGGEELTLAARVGGKAQSAYPDGPPEIPVVEGEEPLAPLATPVDGWKTEGDVQIIVISDSDMLQDNWWVNLQNFFGNRIASPTANNSDLLINSLDNLTGNSDLISLRSRTGFERPFTRVDEMRKESEDRYREEEQRLQAELEEAERKIAELQTQKEGAVTSLIVTPEQRAEIEKFRVTRLETRKKLRDVKHSLKKDIEALGIKIKVLNFLVPLLVAFLGLFMWLYNSRKATN